MITLHLHGMMDVAPRGTASQSSTSRWSLPDDAQRAVQGLAADYAFHTDCEPDPWWMLDLEQVYYPTVIVISNRRSRQLWDVTKKLSVSVSEDGESWTTLHHGEVQFGTREDGIPLIIPTHERFGVRFVKISNSGETYLHLSSVSVFVQDLREGREKNAVFVANRTDGLGARLMAIVNAIALSRYFKTGFEFSWDPVSSMETAADHAIGSPSDIFSDDFLQNHLSDGRAAVSLVDFLANEGRGEHGEQSKVLVPWTSIYDASSSLRTAVPPQALSDAFWQIGFSEKMARAINLARNLPLAGEGVGLHLRAGDIIYGRYRFNARFTSKVLPYPLCISFIESEKSKGHQPVLFGQDRELCHSISEHYGAIFVGDYHEQFEFDDHQAAIFDIVLMSRCKKVFGGSSAFSLIAQIAGQFELLDPSEILPAEERVSVLRHFVTGDGGNHVAASDLQRSFCYWYMVFFFGDHLSNEELETCLRTALELDPCNSFYGVVLAVHLFQVDKHDESEAVLDYVASADFPRSSFGSLLSVARNRDSRRRLMLHKYLPPLKAMADCGMNAAVGLYAVACDANGNKTDALHYLERYAFSVDGSRGPLEDEMALLAAASVESETS